MFRHGGRRLELIPFEEAGRRTLELPRDKLIKQISLNFEAVCVVAGGAASGTVVQDSTLLMIPLIEVYGDGSVLLFRLSGRNLYYKNMFEYGALNTLAVPATGDEGDHVLSCELVIDFRNNIGLKPADSYLTAPAFKSLTLNITWGTLNDMWTGTYDREATIAAEYGITPILFETTQPIGNVVRITDYIRKEITATSSDFTVDLPVGDKVYQALMLASLDANCRESDIINYLSLKTDEQFRHYDSLGFVHKQRINKRASSLEALQEGLCYLYLLEDGRIASGLSAMDINTAKLLLDVTVGAGTTYIDCVTDQIVPM